MLVLTMVNAFAALKGRFGVGGGKYGVLGLCTLLAAGVFWACCGCVDGDGRWCWADV